MTKNEFEIGRLESHEGQNNLSNTRYDAENEVFGNEENHQVSLLRVCLD